MLSKDKPCNSGKHLIYVTGGYCAECAICQICGQSMSNAEYQWCIRQDPENPVFEHPSCFSREQQTALENSSISIPQSMFDKLNARFLAIEPNLDLSVETNQYETELQAQKFLAGQSFEYTAMVMKRAESLASACYLTLQKSRRDIDDKLKEHDKQKIQDSIEYRNRQKEPKPSKPSEPRAPKQKDSPEEKLIKMFMKSTGCSRTEAEAMQSEAESKAEARKAAAKGN